MSTVSVFFVINVPCYFWTGLFLVILNLPVSYAIAKNIDLRIRYGLMLSLFLTCALSGVAGVFKAIYRIVGFFAVEHDDDTVIATYLCLFNPIILCDIYTFGSVAVLLLANSVDRYLVISWPVKYYLRIKEIVFWEIVITHLFTLLSFIVIIIICAVFSDHLATIECRQAAYFPENLYTFIVCMRALFTMLSIAVMGLVLLRLRWRVEDHGNFVNDRKLAVFRSKQQSFTRLMIASCMVTLVLDVIPNCISAYAHLWSIPGMAEYTAYTRYASYLNDMNLVLVTSLGQKEIREEMLVRFSLLSNVFRRFQRSSES
ncbi:hypothetical protein Tcan_13887 [Toxocara canis]|uniref:G-protein coupled receptors family 1 profile domain-containing protein n=1 Tax=Toxocara canis TaxID=6265 RepID=A0A0B2V1J3_TOXCA|nr:hypothetical protein Tcan_13887 [Toxocara canis]